MIEYYHWIKAFHIISIISWMAGLLYLPRIFVYHTGVAVGSETYQTFLTMEYKLQTRIMYPAMIASYVFGVLLINFIGFGNIGKWIHIKLGYILLLTACNIMMSKYYCDFKKGENKKSHVFYRVLNEVPTVLMVIIVILAVAKPW